MSETDTLNSVSRNIDQRVDVDFPVKISAEIVVKLFTGDAAFDALRDDWRALYAASDAAPFASFEWAATWFEFFGAARSPYILAAYRGAELIALLPLCLEQTRILGMRLAKLVFINAEIGGAAYLDVLALPAAKPAAARAFWQFLAARGALDCLEFESLAADSDLLAEIIRREGKTKFKVSVAPHNVCQFAAVAAEPDEFLKRIYNDTAKKKLRRIKKLPGFEFRRIVAPLEIAAAFERFVALHDGNWTQKGGSDVSGHSRLLEFHRAAITAIAPRETIFFDELWVEDKCVASLYGFEKGAKYFYYSSGYDEQLVKLSPMVTLYNLSIENGLANGVRCFDFLLGDQPYKAHWTTGKNDLVKVRVRRRTVPALLDEAVAQTRRGLRELSLKILPDNWREQLKAVRRKRRHNFLESAADQKLPSVNV